MLGGRGVCEVGYGGSGVGSCQAPMVERSRYTGPIEALSDAVDMALPDAVRYCEEARGARVDVKNLLRSKELLKNLFALQANGSFRKTQLVEAFGCVAQLHPEWRLGKAEVNDYKVTLARRVGLMCRHIAQAKARPSKPAWLEQIFGGEDEAARDGGGGGEEEAGEGTRPRRKGGGGASRSEYFFGWDSEQRAAWRCRPSTPEQKEFTKRLVPGALDLDPPRAIWPDGCEHAIGELTSLSLKNMDVAVSRKGTAVHYEGATSTGMPIIVKDRADRTPLISIYLASKQVLQLSLGGGMAKEFAIKTMTVIAKMLADGKVERSKLGRVRDKMLADAGFPPQSRGAVRHRPAAAVAAELPSKACEEDDESEAVDAHQEDGQSEAEADALESASPPPSRKRPAAAVDKVSSPTRKALAPPPPSFEEFYGL